MTASEYTFEVTGGVRLDLKAHAANVAITTRASEETPSGPPMADDSGDTTYAEPVSSGVVKVGISEADASSFAVSEEAGTVTVAQDSPGLLAKLVSRKQAKKGDAATITIELPENAAVELEVGSGNLTVAGTLAKSRFQVGKGTAQFHRIFAPAVITVDDGTADLGFVAAPIIVNVRKGKLLLDQVHAPTQISTGTVDVAVKDMHGSIEVQAVTSEVAIDRAHEGLFALLSASSTATVGLVRGTPIKIEVSGFSPSIEADFPHREPLDGEPYVRLHAGGMQPKITVHEVDSE